MGTSIATNLLLSDYSVKAIAPIPSDFETARTQIEKQLFHSESLGLLNKPVAEYLKEIKISYDYSELKDCFLVMECVIEDFDIKVDIYNKIEACVDEHAIIGTNTSAIPISSLQEHLKYPDRFVGIHWAEPAYATRFLEIICGEKTDLEKANFLFNTAKSWGKEPTLLRKDIRGFITNRLMYAVYREGLALEQDKKASIEDLDKCFRYDVGSWISLMGIFQRMDYIGIDHFSKMLDKNLPNLSNCEEIPPIMAELLEVKARGIYSQKGLYEYTAEEAKHWEESFAEFNNEMYHLANKYPYEFKSKNDNHGK
ncbi:hypothetical protein GCM10025777_06320 [Membranihabitans marinus]